MSKNAVMVLVYSLAVVVSLACLTAAFLAAKSHRVAGPTLVERLASNQPQPAPRKPKVYFTLND